MRYSEDNRGKIQNLEAFHQRILYDGIRYESITPTDIDGFFEYHNKLFVFYEFKYKNLDVPRGQLLALQRLCDGLVDGGKQAILYLCTHSEKYTDVNAKECDVERYYYKREWYSGWSDDYKRYFKCGEITDTFMNFCEKHGVIENWRKTS